MHLPCLPVLQGLLWVIFKISCLPAVFCSLPCLQLSFYSTRLLLYLQSQTFYGRWFFLILLRSGFMIIPLRFGSYSFDSPFQLAPVSVLILGTDFFRHHDLLLDVGNQKVFSSSSPGSSAIMLTSFPKPSSHRADLLSICLYRIPRFYKNFYAKI